MKKFLFYTGLVLFGTVLGFFFLEGLVRIFYPHSRDHVIPSGFFKMDEKLGWTLAANKNVTHHSKNFNVVYNTNSFGFRDKYRQPIKEQNSYRILLFGDSQVFGWGISKDNRFSNLLEAQDSSLQILNLGVPGYGLDQEILSYEKFGETVEADEIMFFAWPATLDRCQYDYIFKKYKPRFYVDGQKNLKLIAVPKTANLLSAAIYKLLSPFYLPYFIEQRLALLKKFSENKSPHKEHDANGQSQEEPLLHEKNLLFEKILERAKTTATKRNQQMTIISFLDEQSNALLKSICENLLINFIKIEFDSEYKDLIISEKDQHWNNKANELVASQLYFALQKVYVSKK